MATLALPVSIQTMVIHHDGTVIYYPQVVHLKNTNVQQKINHAICDHVHQLIQEQYKQQGADSFEQMIGTFEVKTNERNILSLSLTNYAYAEHYAHGLTLMNSLTFNVETGKLYQLKDLFKEGCDYKSVL